jgi:EmrB/QacA subfamily drug resistance transporter
MKVASRERAVSQRSVSLPLVLALTSISFFMVSLDALVVVTALPAIHRSVGGSIATLEWAVNAYGLTFAAGIVTAAALGDRIGRRRIYVAGLALFTLASALCAVAPNSGLLIAFRGLQGLGAAAVTPLALTILAAAFPVSRRGSIVGIMGGIGGLAIAGGPLVGGAVVQGLDWHWIFWINVPIGIAAVIGSALFLPSSRGSATRLDLPAVPLIAGAAALIAWALVRVGDSGWGDVKGIAAFVAGAALLAGFVLRERVAAEPMLPLRLFRVRTFSAAGASTFLMSGAIFSAAFLTAQYFQLGLGYSPLGTGLRLLPWTATPMVVAPLAGALADRIGARPLLVGGLRVRPVRGTPRHRRRRSVDGAAHGPHRHPRRGAAQRRRPRLRGEQHDAAVRRGVRHRGGDRGVLRPRAHRFRRLVHRRVPSGDARVGRDLAARRGRRPGGRAAPAGALRTGRGGRAACDR